MKAKLKPGHAIEQLRARTSLRAKTVRRWLKEDRYIVLPGTRRSVANIGILMWDCFGHQPVIIVLLKSMDTYVVKTVMVPSKGRRWNGRLVETDWNIKQVKQLCTLESAEKTRKS